MRFLMGLLFFINTALAADIYSINEKSIEGKDYQMSSLKGKVVLIVNIASQCGYTPQLADLEKLQLMYGPKGLVVLGVPTNDFKEQTPEDDKGMLEFCQKKYDVTFPLLTKSTIKSKGKRALYKFLTEQSPKNLQGEVMWNFEKFLISKKGEVVGRMGSKMSPTDPEMIKQIEAQL